MSLFGFGKKTEEKRQVPTCCCGSDVKWKETSTCCSAKAGDTGCCGASEGGVCCIKVLGAGCQSCHDQYEYVKAAVRALGLSVEVAYITDMEKVIAYGVMSMPAIVVNDQVVSMGKVLKAADVEKLLHKLG
ncbi:MAG: thioredoxin family protein [Faecousia sp.]